MKYTVSYKNGATFCTIALVNVDLFQQLFHWYILR